MTGHGARDRRAACPACPMAAYVNTLCPWHPEEPCLVGPPAATTPPGSNPPSELPLRGHPQERTDMESPTKDRAQGALTALSAAPQPGVVLRDLGGVRLGVVTCSLFEETLWPLLTYRRNRSPIIWSRNLDPANPGVVPGADRESEAEVAAYAALQALETAPRRGQIFRHYKGGLYSVVAASIMVESLTPVVTYISNLKGGAWTRTLANFTGDVTISYLSRGGMTTGPTPRFRRENY